MTITVNPATRSRAIRQSLLATLLAGIPLLLMGAVFAFALTAFTSPASDTGGPLWVPLVLPLLCIAIYVGHTQRLVSLLEIWSDDQLDWVLATYRAGGIETTSWPPTTLRQLRAADRRLVSRTEAHPVATFWAILGIALLAFALIVAAAVAVAVAL